MDPYTVDRSIKCKYKEFLNLKYDFFYSMIDIMTSEVNLIMYICGAVYIKKKKLSETNAKNTCLICNYSQKKDKRTSVNLTSFGNLNEKETDFELIRIKEGFNIEESIRYWGT